MRAGVSTEPKLKESGAELTSVSGAVSEWKMQSRSNHSDVDNRKECGAVVTGKCEGLHFVGTG